MTRNNRTPSFDPVDDYWVKQFRRHITQTERFQFERSLKFFSLTDPLTFIVAHLIHVAHINADEREGRLLAKGSAASDMAEQLLLLHVRLMELIPKVHGTIWALQAEAERVETTFAKWYKADRRLRALGLNGYMKPSWTAVPAWAILVLSLIANAAVELILN